MGQSSRIHVVPSRDGWTLKNTGASIRSFTTQREAIDAAKKTVKRSGGELVVHGRDGKIRDSVTYGTTPKTSGRYGGSDRIVHVIRTGQGWAVEGPGAKKKVHRTRQAAAAEARRILSSAGGGQVVVHGADGRIVHADTVGRRAEARVIKDPPALGQLTKTQIKDAVWNSSPRLRRSK
jgi:hypothetical protein